MKTIVYPVSRVYYEKITPSIKSFMVNSDVDQIILTIEDDKFPDYLPECVKTINVSEQTYFRRNGANIWRTPYVYLCMLRVAYADMFPDLDRVLALDGDTICIRDIGSELWDLDLQGNYFAGVPEKLISKQRGRPYANMGMAVFDLHRIRHDEMQTDMIEALNNCSYQWLEQDCINEHLSLLPISSDYNQSQFTVSTDNPAIMHYAYTQGWERFDTTRTYDLMSWEVVENAWRKRHEIN